MKKKFLILFTILLAFFSSFLVTQAESNDKVVVYLFSRTTCPHCQNAKSFLKKLKKSAEYGKLFEVRNLDIEAHSEYISVFQDAAERMGDEADGVPYIVIGSQSFSGYGSSSDEKIKQAIKDAYEENTQSPIASIVGDYGDVLYANIKNNFIAPVIVLLIAVGIIGVTIYFARQDDDKPTNKVEAKVEKEEKIVADKEKSAEKKEQIVKEKIVEEKAPAKKTTQKTNTTKKKSTKTNQSKKSSNTSSKKKTTSTKKANPSTKSKTNKKTN